MIMNKKIVRREQPVEMEETEPDYVYNLECEKMRIYNNARFYETIKDYPDAMNIVREMVYFNDEIEKLIENDKIYGILFDAGVPGSGKTFR